MIRPNYLVVLALLLCPLAVVSATSPLMPLDEIRPGMTGVGRTVFAGANIEEFKVHILGVLRNIAGPQRNLILAKLEGGPLAETGVIAGMSGSPVYIDGRLAGAISYSLGTFSKEPIAGITPIAEMREVAALSTRRPPRQKAKLDLPITRERLAAALASAFNRVRPFADRPEDVRAVQALGGASEVGAIATMLRPIATPLVMAGFQPDVQETIAGAFRDSGFIPMAGGSPQDPLHSSSEANPAPALRPGDAVGVNLITGDLSLGATGTVTDVEGNTVYAFGHPFYNLGPTDFPMTRAYVHTLLPSLFSSSKISTTGEIIGTFRQDRSTAISGTLGAGPQLIPIKLSLVTERGLKKSFTFDVVNDQLLTPLLTYVSIVNTLTSYEREYGAATFAVKGRAVIRKHGEITFEDVFTGNQPSIGAATYVAGPITFLLGNDFEPVEIAGVDITVTTSEQPRTATLERVWLDTVKPKAGQTVPLKLLLRSYRGEELTRTIPIAIPANASGTLQILVSDGSRLAQWEQREVRQPLEPHDIAQMIRALNKARKNNRLYIRLLSADAGGVVNGEYLSSLPPSVLAVFEADRNGGSFIPLRNATLGEWELQSDSAVTGSRLLTINVDPGE
jgi:hypothetical protein